MKSILLVEDEVHLAKGLMFNLKRAEYEVDLAEDGQSALEKFKEKEYDMMILDIMLPNLDGISVVKKIRKNDQRFPILLLSAKSTDDDRALGLEAGADDYLTKPFHLPELLLRIKGMLRRGEWYREKDIKGEPYVFGDMSINLKTGRAKGCQNEFDLTTKEVQVMNVLIANCGQVVTREELLEKVWGVSKDTETRTVDNFIARLRKYFETNPQKPRHIITVREKGYRFEKGDWPGDENN